MLILSRKINESIVVDGKITIKVLRVDGEVVKLGISAPVEVPVHRLEVYQEIQKSNEEALTRGQRFIPQFSPPGQKAGQTSNGGQEARPNSDRTSKL